MNQCIGRTKKNTRCQRRVKKVFCKQHLPEKHWDDIPDECIICCEQLRPEDSILSCGHYIHWACLDRWEQGYKCPICKRSLPEFSRRKPSLPCSESEPDSPTLTDYMEELSPSYMTLTLDIPENDYEFVMTLLETYFKATGGT